MEHTKEPWQVSRVASLNIETEDGVSVASCGGRSDNRIDPEYLYNELQQNARRIVACVNACAGILNNELESISYAQLLESHNYIQLQRDELLAALKGAEEQLRYVGNGCPDEAVHAAAENCRAAIAKAEATS